VACISNDAVLCFLPLLSTTYTLRMKSVLSAYRTHHVQVLTYDKAHTATTQLFPSVARTAELVASQPGIWQYNCDVQDHLVAGMSTPVHSIVVQYERVHVMKGCDGPHGLWFADFQECKPDS
jgi:Multicopper oxidase